MKKFYSFLFAAVALVGFAACNSDSTEEPAPAQENVGKMEFTANIGEATKTQLEGTKVKWCAEDAIAVSNGTKVEMYTVKELLNDGKSAIFQGAALEGDTFYAVYPYAEDAAYTGGKWNVTIPTEQVAVAGSFADGAALAYGEYQGDYTFSFTNKNAVLKFQVSEDCSFVQFYNGSNLAVELKGGLTAGETYYAAVAPGQYTFTVRIDACLSKKSEKVLDLEKNTIYNIKTLPAKQTKTVYLVPGVWASDNADFAVYFWNGSSDNDLLMTKDTTKNGVYKAEVAADAEGIIFKRLNPADHQEWNKTADLTLPADEKDHYYVTDWAAGEWREYVQKEWALAGTFNNWEDMPMTRKDAVISVAEGVNLKAYDQFKVKDATTWNTNYGAGFSNMNPGHYMAVTYNGGEIAITAAGTYDIYFDEINELIYVVTTGSDYKTATEQTANGEDPKVEEDAAKLYLNPGSNWMSSNAWFAAYFFENGTTWRKMTDEDGDGIYECEMEPGGKKYPKVIFCRMDSGKMDTLDWDARWNQTGNLNIPTDGKNLYIKPNNTWDGATDGTNWSTYTPAN